MIRAAMARCVMGLKESIKEAFGGYVKMSKENERLIHENEKLTTERDEAQQDNVLYAAMKEGVEIRLADNDKRIAALEELLRDSMRDPLHPELRVKIDAALHGGKAHDYGGYKPAGIERQSGGALALPPEREIRAAMASQNTCQECQRGPATWHVCNDCYSRSADLQAKVDRLEADNTALRSLCAEVAKRSVGTWFPDDILRTKLAKLAVEH